METNVTDNLSITLGETLAEWQTWDKWSSKKRNLFGILHRKQPFVHKKIDY